MVRTLLYVTTSSRLTITLTEDTRVLLAARQEARRQFDEHKRVGIDTPMQINHAIEVASILKHNIVQGVKEEGNEAAKWGTLYLIIYTVLCMHRV